MKKFWGNLKEYQWKKLFTAKNFVIVGCLALVGVAIGISAMMTGTGDNNVLGNESDKTLGNTVLADGTVAETSDSEGTAETEKDDFFASAILNREQTREESLEVLNQLANNPEAMPDTKEDALNAIARLAANMNAEANIETLVKAKGFKECVAIVSDQSCTVVVSSGGLSASETAIVFEIVCEQTEISPTNIKIVGKS